MGVGVANTDEDKKRVVEVFPVERTELTFEIVLFTMLDEAALIEETVIE